MIPLSVVLDVEGQWPDLDGKPSGDATAVGFLPNGTAAGKPAVFIRGKVKLADGTETDVVLQTTFALIGMAVRAGIGRYGDPNS